MQNCVHSRKQATLGKTWRLIQGVMRVLHLHRFMTLDGERQISALYFRLDPKKKIIQEAHRIRLQTSQKSSMEEWLGCRTSSAFVCCGLSVDSSQATKDGVVVSMTVWTVIPSTDESKKIVFYFACCFAAFADSIQNPLFRRRCQEELSMTSIGNHCQSRSLSCNLPKVMEVIVNRIARAGDTRS